VIDLAQIRKAVEPAVEHEALDGEQVLAVAQEPTTDFEIAAVAGDRFPPAVDGGRQEPEDVELVRDQLGVGEAPGAYKDIAQVMAAQRELTRIVRRLRPIVSYKGGS